MSQKLNLDPNKASKSEQKDLKEEDFAVILVELLQNVGVLLAQISESQAILADCAKRTLEIDEAMLEAEEDEDDIEPIEPEIH